MAQALRPTSVSQAIDDDECGSFIVVRPWTNEHNEVKAEKEAKKEELHEDHLDDDEERDEQFSDAAADLDLGSSSETLASANLSIEDQGRGHVDLGNESGTMARFIGPPTSLITMSQEGTMLDDERFSMTNYSTASSSSDQQLEELQTKLTQVIGDHRGLLDLLEKQNLELEQRKMTIEELKLLANESVFREKQKSEESRKIVEKITSERDLAIEQLETRITTINPGMDALETLESQLKQREHILKQNDEQIKELSTRLHQEIIKREEVTQLLRMKEEEDRVKSDSLSSSDEALARSLSEKERLEQVIEDAMKERTALQQEILNLKEQLATMTNDNSRMQTLGEKLDSQCAAIDTENHEMRIKLAALEAEKERQIELYNEEVSKNETLEEEKLELRRDLGKLTEMLQVRTTELQDSQAQIQQMGNSMSGSVAGNLLGGFFNRQTKPNQKQAGGVIIPPGAKSYGMRDANDDPNEPFHETFEHVGTHQANQPNATHGVPQTVYQCPICLKRFDDLRKLEYHASNCGVDNAMNTDPFVFP